MRSRSSRATERKKRTMKKSEVAQLLVFKHSTEGTELVEAQVEAWHLIIGGLDFMTAMEATICHYRDADLDHNGNAPKLMPRHIVAACENPLHSSSWAGNVTEQRLARERAALEATA